MILVIMVLASCTSENIQTDQTNEIDNHVDVETIEELLESLQEVLGSENVELTKEFVNQPFFKVEGKVMRIMGKDVQVFEYNSVETREKESNISPDGFEINQTMPMWVDQPNFWAAGG